MFERILVASDLSDASDCVVGCLSPLRTVGAEEVRLVYCLGIHHLTELEHLLAPMVEPRVARQKTTLEQAGFKVTVEIEPGLPQHEINRVAVGRDGSLVVVGSHGRTMSGEIHLGGVASEIIHNIRKPILLIRLKITTLENREQCEAVCPNMLDHVLSPTDFSDNADLAFETVRELAAHGARRIMLMHVQGTASPNSQGAELIRIDRERLERLKTELNQGSAADVTCELSYGSPLTEILRRSADGSVSLIVMGSQGRGYISELFLGSLSHNVARLANVHVLLIPLPR